MSEQAPIAVVAAMRSEATRILTPVHVTGVGRERVCAAIERLIGESRPGRVVMIGFAGGLDPTLRIGDAVRVRRLLHEGSEPIELDDGDAALLTVDTLIDSPSAKAELRRRTGADAVDMESYHVAAMLRGHGIPLTVIRAISDTADDAVAPEVARFVRPDGTADVGRTMRHLLTHPHHLPMLLRLARASDRAARALADTLSAWRNENA